MLLRKKITENKTDIGTMFSRQQLRRLIFPLIVEQILAITVGMVDTMMISYAGEAAISGVSLVDMINVLLINIFAAVATGGAVVVYLGVAQILKGGPAQNPDRLLRRGRPGLHLTQQLQQFSFLHGRSSLGTISVNFYLL